jgi:hypothetical protein
MLRYTLALGFVGGVGVSTGSQEPACPTDAQRGQAAVRFARELNTAQAAFRAQNRRYGHRPARPRALATAAAPPRAWL